MERVCERRDRAGGTKLVACVQCRGRVEGAKGDRGLGAHRKKTPEGCAQSRRPTRAAVQVAAPVLPRVVPDLQGEHEFWPVSDWK